MCIKLQFILVELSDHRTNQECAVIGLIWFELHGIAT